MKKNKVIFILLMLIGLLTNLQSQTNVFYNSYGVMNYAEFDPDSTSGYSDDDFFSKILNLDAENKFIVFNLHGTEDDIIYYKDFQ